MRENKFRYTVIKGSGHVMVETFPLGDIENGRVVTWLKVNHASDDTCEIHVDQFTGLTDKNGVEIFEEDILSDGHKYLTVSYKTVNGAFWATNETYRIYAHKFKIFGIIGNIHEHASLIKGEQQ